MNLKIIIKNIALLSTSELISRAINFVSYAILARAILAEGFGIFSFVFSIVSYITLLVNFGTDTIGNRDVARDNCNHSEYLNKLLSFRFTVAIIFYLIFGLTLSIIDLESTLKNALLIYGLTFFANAILINWFFRGIEKNLLTAVGQIVSSLIGLLLIYSLVHSSSDIIAAVWIYTIIPFINSFILITIYLYSSSKIRFSLDLSFIREILRASAPVGISAIMINIYYNSDHIILGAMGYNTELGFYSAAYKIILIAIIPSSLVWQSFFPQLSKSANDNFQKLELMRNYSKIMFILGISIATIVLLFSNEIISIAYGNDFEKSIGLLNILGINILLVYVNMVYGNPLIAWGDQKRYSYVIATGALTNIILNILLIPRFNAYGAAVATIASELAVFFGVILIHWISLHNIYFRTFIKCLVSGIVAGAIVIICNSISCPKGVSFIILFIILMTSFIGTGLLKLNSIKKIYTS